MDLFEKCKHTENVDEAVAAGLYPYFHALETMQDSEVIMEGHRTIMPVSYTHLLKKLEKAVDSIGKYGGPQAAERKEQLKRKIEEYREVLAWIAAK